MVHRSLCAPAETFAASYIEALREGYHLGDDPPFDAGAIAGIAVDLPAHLAAITRQGVPHVFPDGSTTPLSPFILFWFIENGVTFLGSLHLRYELANDYARLITGHVRYGVRPSRRNQGIGREMLTLGKSAARAIGHHRIMLSCRDDNIPSRRVIETCGGILESIIMDPYGAGPMRRYWITL